MVGHRASPGIVGPWGGLLSDFARTQPLALFFGFGQLEVAAEQTVPAPGPLLLKLHVLQSCCQQCCSHQGNSHKKEVSASEKHVSLEAQMPTFPTCCSVQTKCTKPSGNKTSCHPNATCCSVEKEILVNNDPCEHSCILQICSQPCHGHQSTVH